MKILSKYYKFYCQNVLFKFITITLIIILLIIPLLTASAKKTAANAQPPTAPENLTYTSVTQASAALKWDASTGSKKISYMIYKNAGYLTSTYNTSYTVSGLTPGTAYSFYIIARDNSNKSSSPSNILTLTTLTDSSTTSAPPETTTAATTTATTTTRPSTTQPSPTLSKLVVGYYGSWAAYSGYTPLNIPASKLTTINYAFANISNDLKITLGDPSVDTANFSKLSQLKKSYPNLKTIISVGGWTWSGKFSDAALTDSSRTAFANSVVAFIKQYGFDGVDLDWEYPVSGGLGTNTYRPEDKTNFTLLLKKTREKLDAQGAVDGKHYILSIAGGSGATYTNNTELSKISSYIDYANVMTYDLHGPWDKYTDFNSALYTQTETSPQYKISVDSAIKNWISKGFPASKIVMGVPFYGYKYSGAATNNGLYSTYSSAASISYDNIVSTYLNSYSKFYHADAKVPWLFNGSVFITYDDAQSIAAKTRYAVENKLSGVAVWELSQNKDGTLLNAIYSNIK